MVTITIASLLEFSHVHCVAICAVLVPLNLLAALQSLVLVGRRSPRSTLLVSAALASLLAVVMLLHVLSWFLIGVVMTPTYVLLGLAGVCLCLNSWAVAAPGQLFDLGNWGYQRLRSCRLQVQLQAARDSADSL